MAAGDLKAFRLGEVDDHGTASVDAAATELCKYYNETIDWYLREKVAKSRYSKSLRLTSLILAVVGGIIPLTATFDRLNQSWGYVFLGLAGGLQLVDKFFGYSSAWNRYMSTAMSLNSQLMLLQLDLARSQALKADKKAQWDIVNDYATKLATAISGETSQWATEFKESADTSATRAVTQEMHQK